MGDVSTWAVTASGNNTGSPPDYPTEGQAPSTVNDTMREIMAAVSRFIKDTNGSVTSGGASSAYTLTPNQTIGAYAAGQVFAFKANHTSTTAPTLNVSSLGAKSIVHPSGTALGAGDIQSGGIYAVIYDGTNFQMTSPGGSLSLTGTSAVDLSDAVAPLLVGPGSGQHIEADGNSIQSKSDATTAGTVEINALGGNVNIGAQSGTGQVAIYYNGALVFAGIAGGIVVRDNSADDPEINMQSDAGTTLSRIVHAGGSGLIVESLEHGSVVQLKGEDASGVSKMLFDADPDGNAFLHFAGSRAFYTQSTSCVIQSTSDDNPYLAYFQDDGVTQNGFIQAHSTSGLIIRNQVHGLPVSIQSENNSGSDTNLFVADPDGQAVLYYAGANKAATQANGFGVAGEALELSTGNANAGVYILRNTEGGGRLLTDGGDMRLRQVDADGSSNPEEWVVMTRNGAVTLYYDNASEIATAAHATNSSGGTVKDGGGTARPIGFNVTPITAVTANTDLRVTNVGHQLRATTASIVIDMDATTDSAPDGSVWVIVNESGGNISLTATGVTNTWLDGAGGSTGTRTIADGSMVTVTKRANGQYQTVGNGLS